jgi:arginine decarboxylase
VPIRHSGKRVPFEKAPAELLATDPTCLMLDPGEPWHGFEGLPDRWCMLDPIKLGILCPGMTEDGQLTEHGIPGDLVSVEGIEERDGKYNVYFLHH